jgi:hypothetical protein
VRFFIRGNTLRTARVIGRRRRFVTGSLANVEFGEAEPLAEKYPHVAEENRSSPLSS